MKTTLLCMILGLAGLFFGCKDLPLSPDCQLLRTGIVNGDNVVVGTEIDKLCADLFPNPQADDEYGQKDNLQVLADRINAGGCGITATVFCYACIETLPPQSEIRLSCNHNGMLTDRTIDISFTNDNMLKFVNMHE